jgi:hypothetical protein
MNTLAYFAFLSVLILKKGFTTTTLGQVKGKHTSLKMIATMDHLQA